MLLLSAVFMLMTFVVFVGYGLFAAAVRDHVISRPRVLTWMRRTFAAAFVALGARLALPTADRVRASALRRPQPRGGSVGAFPTASTVRLTKLAPR